MKLTQMMRANKLALLAICALCLSSTGATADGNGSVQVTNRIVGTMDGSSTIHVCAFNQNDSSHISPHSSTSIDLGATKTVHCMKTLTGKKASSCGIKVAWAAPNNAGTTCSLTVEFGPTNTSNGSYYFGGGASGNVLYRK